MNVITALNTLSNAARTLQNSGRVRHAPTIYLLQALIWAPKWVADDKRDVAHGMLVGALGLDTSAPSQSNEAVRSAVWMAGELLRPGSADKAPADQIKAAAAGLAAVEVEADTPAIADPEERIATVLGLIESTAMVDGAHHKNWLFDRIVQTLTGSGYEEWVRNYEAGEDGPNTFEWDRGIAP